MCYKIRPVAKESAQFPCTLGTNRNLTSLFFLDQPSTVIIKRLVGFLPGSVLVLWFTLSQNLTFPRKNGKRTEFGKPVPSAAADYITRGSRLPRGAPVLRPHRRGLAPFPVCEKKIDQSM